MADPESTAEQAPQDATPTVVVSHLSVTYRVLGGERRGAPSNQGEGRSLRQLLRPGTGARTRTREIHAVKDVSFVAHHGESIGIIGRNGSGKSTLLRAVAGLIPPSEGKLWVAGEPSLLGVNAVLINKLSGERNIYIGGQALGLTTAEIDEKFDDIVEFSGIGDAVYLPMSTYSSGMGARLRFAISTAAAPDVLMIDEALATGDAAFRQKSAKRIAAIREAAGTVFLVSHSNSNIREICDRVLWMDQGELIMDGPTEQVLPAYEASLPKSKAHQKDTDRDEPAVPGTVRWTGNTRVQAARAISRDTWAPGVQGCFVVSVDRMAVARMVAPIAARLGWPMLWVRPGSIPAATRDELGRLAPERVIVVGGGAMVDAERYSRIEEMVSGTVERLGTDDPARTGALLLEAFPPQDASTVYVTHPNNSGRIPVTSLQAALTGRAVVVCDIAGVAEELTVALAGVRPQRLVLLGHEEEWPGDAVDALRQATAAEIEFSPEGGPMAIAAGLWEGSEPGGRVIISGAATVEMLSATVTSAHTGTPMLLVTAGRLPDLVRTALERLAPSEIVLSGAIEALPPELRQSLGEIVAAGSPAVDASRPL